MSKRLIGSSVAAVACRDMLLRKMARAKVMKAPSNAPGGIAEACKGVAFSWPGSQRHQSIKRWRSYLMTPFLFMVGNRPLAFVIEKSRVSDLKKPIMLLPLAQYARC